MNTTSSQDFVELANLVEQVPAVNKDVDLALLKRLLETKGEVPCMDLHQAIFFRVDFFRRITQRFACREELNLDLRQHIVQLYKRPPATIKLVFSINSFLATPEITAGLRNIFRSGTLVDVYQQVLDAFSRVLFGTDAQVKFEVPNNLDYNTGDIIHGTYNPNTEGTYTFTLSGKFLCAPALIHFLVGMLREVTVYYAHGYNILGEGVADDWEVISKVLANMTSANRYDWVHKVMFWTIARWGTKAITGSYTFRECWDAYCRPGSLRFPYRNRRLRWTWGQGLDIFHKPYKELLQKLENRLRATYD